MKTRYTLRVLAAGFALAATSAAHVANAQSFGNSHPVTRAQVQGELAQIEAAGYDPHRDSSTYPADLQAAEARVSAAQAGSDQASSDPKVHDATKG